MQPRPPSFAKASAGEPAADRAEIVTAEGGFDCFAKAPRRLVVRHLGHLRNLRFPRIGFLTADFADFADEEAAVSLSELPGLLFQATCFVTRFRIAPRGWQPRMDTDSHGSGPLVLWTVVPLVGCRG